MDIINTDPQYANNPETIARLYENDCRVVSSFFTYFKENAQKVEFALIVSMLDSQIVTLTPRSV